HPILRHAVEVAVDFGRLQELAPRPRFLKLCACHEDVVDAVDLTRPPRLARRGHRESVLRRPQAHLLDDGVFPHAGGAGDDDKAWARERAQLFYEFIRLLVPSHPSRHQVLPSPAPLPKRHAPSTRPPLHYHSWPLLGFDGREGDAETMFDVLTIAALADELASRLVGGRIQRILQIDDATIGLEVYAEHQRSILVASADSRNPRLYLSTQRLSADPDRVTPLLLLLRKYARGGRVAAVQQPPLERIMRLSIAKPFYPDNRRKRDDAPTEDDETPSELVYTHLIVELMGRRSNIILTDDEGRILDAIKRVTPDMSRVRPILPGRPYVPPPPREDVVDPRHLPAGALHDLLRPAPPDEELAPLLVRHLAGFSPQMAREAVHRATGEADAPVHAVASRDGAAALAEAIKSVLAPLETGDWTPSVYLNEGRAVAFAAIPLDHLADAEVERFPTM